MHESEVAQLCLTPSNPMDCSLPGSSVHGIFQARVLEWGAIAFSDLVRVFPNSFFQIQLEKNVINVRGQHDVPRESRTVKSFWIFCVRELEMWRGSETGL